MDPEYARQYRRLWEHHWWWRARRGWILERLRRIRPTTGWRRILDVGCGEGLFFKELLELGDVEGIEPDADLVARSEHRDRIHVGRIDKDPDLPGRYSLILMLDVLEHLDAPVHALRNAVRWLEPTGTVLITVPAFNLLWTSHDVLNRHRTRYTRKRLREQVREAGLTVRESRYFFHWLVPLKLGIRALEGVAGATPTVPRLPPKPLNSLLYGAARLELRLSGLFPIPAGTSLLLLASRAREPR